MFGVGPLEMVVIIVVAVLVFGPERVPEMIRSLMRVVRQLRAMASNAQTQFRDELGQLGIDEETQKSWRELRSMNPREALMQHLAEDETEPDNRRAMARSMAEDPPSVAGVVAGETGAGNHSDAPPASGGASTVTPEGGDAPLPFDPEAT